MVTIKMVAERCGLSVGAVSKALNHQPGISPEKAAWVRQVAAEMRYHPNAAARTLKTSRSKNIGIIFENRLIHEFFSEVLEAVRACLTEKNYDMTFLNSRESQGMSYYEHAMQLQCDGVMVVHGRTRGALEELMNSDIPLVTIDHILYGHTAVVSDNADSFRKIIPYLVQMGHRRIAMVHGEDGDVTRLRVAGFHNACRECGLEIPEEYVLEARYHEPKDSGLATRKLLALKEPPTCILYPDDISILGGTTEIERQGLSVPEDICCFGYDGNRLSRLLRPSLATYRQNTERMGRVAAEELIQAIEDTKCYIPRIITVEGAVQPGDSVRQWDRGGKSGEEKQDHEHSKE